MCPSEHQGQGKGRNVCRARAGSGHKPAFQICRKFLLLLRLLPAGPTTCLGGEAAPKENTFHVGKAKPSPCLQPDCEGKMLQMIYFYK